VALVCLLLLLPWRLVAWLVQQHAQVTGAVESAAAAAAAALHAGGVCCSGCQLRRCPLPATCCMCLCKDPQDGGRGNILQAASLPCLH
jgi:hypothetical protein